MKTSRSIEFKTQPGKSGVRIDSSRAGREGSKLDGSKLDSGEVDCSEVEVDEVGKIV